MDAVEFAEWMQFDKVEPIGGQRADYHAAMIAWAVRSPHVDRRSREKVEDFIPKWGPAEWKQPTRGLADKIRSYLSGKHGNARRP